jgi:hypothetical protein
MIGGPPGFPRIPNATDDIAAPHHVERVVRLAHPFTARALEKACESVGFSKPSQSVLAGIAGTQCWQTKTGKSFGSFGETIEVEIVSPLEVVVRSASKLPSVPFFDWKKNEGNVEKLARALGSY